MIVSNNSRLFGLSHVGVVKCPTFGCMVCTAPDGMFKGCSTIFHAFDGDEWNHSPHLVLVARALLHPTLPKKERATVHGIFLQHLDHCGNKGYELDNALDEVFAVAKDRGAIVESINKAHELWTNAEAKAARLKAALDQIDIKGALEAMVDQGRAQSKADGERLMVLMKEYKDRLGRAAVSFRDGEVFVHPDLARELDNPGNEGLREMLFNMGPMSKTLQSASRGESK